MIEKIVRVGVSSIIEHNRKILMGLRKGSLDAGKWGFPGGHQEFGETIFETSCRELFEETGICVIPSDFVYLTWTNDVFVDDRKHYVTFFTMCRLSSASQPRVKLMEPRKCEEWRWVEEFPENVSLPIENLFKEIDVKVLRGSLFNGT